MASEGAEVLHKVEQKALAADILEGQQKETLIDGKRGRVRLDRAIPGVPVRGEGEGDGKTGDCRQ